MNTTELIDLLRIADPDGDTEVSVGNTPIFYVERTEAYFDGPQEVLVVDKNIKSYNVVGARYRSQGHKVCIETHSIGDYLAMDPRNGTVDYSELTEEQKRGRMQLNEERRQNALEHELELSLESHSKES